MKKLRRMMAILLTVCCVCVFAAAPTFAASNQTKTQNYDVLRSDNVIKALNCYGRDSFRITYNGNKVIACTATQTKSDLGSGLYEKGGIKCTKKTSGKWTYQSVWKLNLRLMPKSMVPLAKKYAPALVALQKVGTILKVTTTYEVNANGTLKKVKTSLQWFTTLASYKNAVAKWFRF